MGRLVVIFFETPAGAERALNRIMHSQRARELLDVCAVVREEDGSISLEQTRNRLRRAMAPALTLGALAGAAFGWLLLNYWIGVIAGTAAGLWMGALLAKPGRFGIKTHVAEHLGSYLNPDSSALLLLFRRGVPESFRRRLQRARAAIVNNRSDDDVHKDLKDKLIRLQAGQRLYESSP